MGDSKVHKRSEEHPWYGDVTSLEIEGKMMGSSYRLMLSELF